MRISTSRSRSVSRSSPSLVTSVGTPECVVVRANSCMSRRVTEGDSSASPEATMRMPARRSSGRVRFSRKPLAPARTASYT